MENIAQLKKELSLIKNSSAAWHFVWARNGGDGKPKLRLRKTPFKPGDIAAYRKKGKQKLLVQGRVGKAEVPGAGTVLRFACTKNHDNAELQRHLKKTLASKVSALRGAVIELAGAEETTAAEPRVVKPERVPKMRVGEKIGEGAFGAIRRLEDDDGDGLVVKFASAGGAMGLEDIQEEAAAYQKLEAAGLAEHPNIVRCFGIHEFDGETGLVMEEVKGGTVEDVFDQLRQLRPSREAQAQGQQADGPELGPQEYWGTVQHVLRGVVEGLAALEQAGFQHVDFKGANAMLDEDGTPKLIDLGSLSEIGAQNPGPGSPVFEPPERRGAIDMAPTETDDSWALGVLLYQLVEGEWYFDGEKNPRSRLREEARDYVDPESDHAALHPVDGDPTGQGQYRAGFDSAYVTFLQRLLHPDREQRISATEALEMPFLADPILQEEDARAVLSDLRERREEAAAEATVDLPTLLGERKEILARCKRLQKDAGKLNKGAKATMDRLAKKGGRVPAKVIDQLRSYLDEVAMLEDLLAEDDRRVSLAEAALADETDEAARAKAELVLADMRHQVASALADASAARVQAAVVLSRAENEGDPDVALDISKLTPPPVPGTEPAPPMPPNEARDAVVDIIEEQRPALKAFEKRAKDVQKKAQAVDKVAGKLLKLHLAGKAVPTDVWADVGLCRVALEGVQPEALEDLSALATTLRRIEDLPPWMSDEGNTLADAAVGDGEGGLNLRIASQIGVLKKLRARQEAALSQAQAALKTLDDTIALVRG